LPDGSHGNDIKSLESPNIRVDTSNLLLSANAQPGEEHFSDLQSFYLGNRLRATLNKLS
jgi:hypothetical protein